MAIIYGHQLLRTSSDHHSTNAGALTCQRNWMAPWRGFEPRTYRL